MLGRYDNGIGKTWDDPDYMKFYNDGYVTFPYLSDGMWFMTQHRRWGLLKAGPGLPGGGEAGEPPRHLQGRRGRDQGAVAEGPDAHVAKLIDGVVWDGKDPKTLRRRRSRSRWPEVSRHERSPTLRRSPVKDALAEARRGAGRSASALAANAPMPAPAAATAGRQAGYVRTRAPEWLVQRARDGARASRLRRRSGRSLAKAAGACPTRRHRWRGGGEDLRRSVLPQGAERPGHRLERAVLARSASASASASRRWSASRSAS